MITACGSVLRLRNLIRGVRLVLQEMGSPRCIFCVSGSGELCLGTKEAANVYIENLPPSLANCAASVCSILQTSKRLLATPIPIRQLGVPITSLQPSLLSNRRWRTSSLENSLRCILHLHGHSPCYVLLLICLYPRTQTTGYSLFHFFSRFYESTSPLFSFTAPDQTSELWPWTALHP